MSLKHANEIQEELKINKDKTQSEYYKYTEERLFQNIERCQGSGETCYLDFPYELSLYTIQKLKDLDYVVKRCRYGLYNVYWGADRHKKKGWF